MWKISSPLENRNGVLHFEDYNTLELAVKYGTPLYVYSEKRIIKNYRTLTNAFAKRYRRFKLHYAVKANSNLAVLKILRRAGAGADCASPAEIFLALQAGFKPGDILYSGNYNSDDELAYACRKNVKMNLDDIQFLDRIMELSKMSSVSLPDTVCFRLDPGTGRGKFKGLVTSGPNTKFGLQEREILKAYVKAKDYGFESFGIHMMTGSCILDESYFEGITDKLFETAGMISRKAGINFDFIDIGGGFGISYEKQDRDLDIDRLGAKIVQSFKEKSIKYSLGEPYLYIEPGRYIVGDAGILLTRVNSVKKARKTFVGVDSGMNTLLRPALYGAYHRICLANGLNRRMHSRVDIVGQICESTDFLARDRMMPRIQKDDLLAIMNTGAYSFSMSSQYNGRPRPAELLIGSRPRLIRSRETFEDLLHGQRS